MPAIPKAEMHPAGLPLHWEHVWDNALRTMKDQDSWSFDLRPLLDEYVFSLVEAAEAREDGRRPDWDRASKRASALADQLALTPRGRKAAGIATGDEDQAADPFAEVDELAARRAAS